jgi:hypothetical protein
MHDVATNIPSVFVAACVKRFEHDPAPLAMRARSVGWSNVTISSEPSGFICARTMRGAMRYVYLRRGRAGPSRSLGSDRIG